MNRQNRETKKVKVGFCIEGNPQTLLMSRTDAKKMDIALLSEKTRFRLKNAYGHTISFYFTPQDFFFWKCKGFETLYSELSQRNQDYSCQRGGKGFIGDGIHDDRERQWSNPAIRKAA